MWSVRRAAAWIAALALPLAVGVPVAMGQMPAAEERMDRDIVEVALGGSTVLRVTEAVSKATLTDPQVADVSSVGGKLLVIGRKVGETNLIMIGQGRRTSTLLVKVTLPARAIQSEMARMFPGEDIEVRAVGGSLVLLGTVSGSPIVEQSEQVALGYLRSPSIAGLGVRPHVINLLKVRGRQQVMLEVKFAEVSRRSLREVGANILVARDDGRVAGAFGRRAVFEADAGNARNLTGNGQGPLAAGAANGIFPGGVAGQTGDKVYQGLLSNNTNGSVASIFFGGIDGTFPFAATLNLLASRNLSRTLAEPTLIALSGQPASFLAGGEVPYVTASFQGSNVDFKPFGIELQFTPTVLDDQTIQLKARASVSAPDPTVSVVLNNQATQGFRRREAQTVIRMRDGQSFAIAGLLSDEMENLIEKVPGLGDLPILGILFSSKSFNRRETELMVVVTARLVEPLDEEEVPPLPGERRFTDPSDLELFLLNLEPTVDLDAGNRVQARPRIRRRPSGSIGFWR